MGFNYIHSQSVFTQEPTGKQWNYITLCNICVPFTSGLGVTDTLWHQLYSAGPG